jgi:uncharacterized protein YjbI with pentapeptide repeats
MARLFRINLAPTDIMSQADLFPADPIQTLCPGWFRIRSAIIGANLANTHFDKAYLAEATLTHADFRRATLVGANLTGATLTNANLREANLSWTDLSGANLTEANLTHATLIGVPAVTEQNV